MAKPYAQDLRERRVRAGRAGQSRHRSLYAVANNHRVAVTASGPREAVDTRLRQMDR